MVVLLDCLGQAERELARLITGNHGPRLPGFGYVPQVRRPWPALVLLLGGVLLLVSLYLPWQRVSLDRSYFENEGGAVEALLQLFAGADSLDGWKSAVAPATALAALLLVGLSAVAWARPLIADRLPLGRSALVAGYFALAVAVDTRSGARLLTGSEGGDGVDIVFAYGTYVGLSAGAALLLAALILRRADLLDYWSTGAVAAGVLSSGLLVGFLLPWERFGWYQATGISVAAAQVAALFALCIPSAWRSGHVARLGLALLAALFTAAAFSTVTTTLGFARAYGSWVAIGFATGLIVLALTGGVRRPEIEQAPWSRLVLAAACLLLVASFFLPWQEVCPSGRCVSMNAWPGESAPTAALLAIALIVGEFARMRRMPPLPELAAGIALFVTTLGYQVGYGGQFGLGYGFWVGVACAGVIVVLAAASLGRPPLDARLAPIALCFAYLAVVVPTWWRALVLDAPRLFWFAPFSWITIVGVLLALTLIRLWLERPPDSRPLLLVPGVMAVLATLDLVAAEAITWGGGIVLGLCAFLALFAWVEHGGGLRRLEIPGALRLDRL